ncbi:MAG TPA: hypothetical protein VFX94_05565 [Burkholderiales bacterium]|nr:hypothetical protein [Burkholderiales bacterium]
MHCELVVPGLLAGGGASRFVALELLLARGRRSVGEAKPLEGWVQDAFELGEGAYPAGALTRAAQGADPGEDPWTRADPVHLRVVDDQLVVVPAEAFALQAEEASALCEALNAHFVGMEFTLSQPRRWCARLAATDETRPAIAAAGTALELPKQAARVLTEIQMVLHAHPVNEAREARGEPAVNSVWLWGAGRAPRARAPWQSVAADDPAVLGAARLAAARQRALPRSAEAWLERLPDDGRHLAVLDALRAPLALGADTVQEELEKLEREWFAPLLAALRAARIGMLTLHVPDAAEALSCEIIRADLRRFWRLRQPLKNYT